MTLILRSDLNRTARVQNAHLSNASDQISPFLNPSTGAAIVGFPSTSAQLSRMSEPTLDAVLEQSGLPTAMAAATLAMKKRQLRVHIGLRAECTEPNWEECMEPNCINRLRSSLYDMRQLVNCIDFPPTTLREKDFRPLCFDDCAIGRVLHVLMSSMISWICILCIHMVSLNPFLPSVHMMP